MYLNKITLSLILKPIFLKNTIKYKFLETISVSFQKVLISIFKLKTVISKVVPNNYILFFSFALEPHFWNHGSVS